MLPLRLQVQNRVFEGHGVATIHASECGRKRAIVQAHMDGYEEFGEAMEAELNLDSILVECVLYHQGETHQCIFPASVTFGEGPEAICSQHWILYAVALGSPFGQPYHHLLRELGWPPVLETSRDPEPERPHDSEGAN